MNDGDNNGAGRGHCTYTSFDSISTAEAPTVAYDSLHHCPHICMTESLMEQLSCALFRNSGPRLDGGAGAGRYCPAVD